MATVTTQNRSVFGQYAMYWLLALATLVAAVVLAVGAVSDSDSDSSPAGRESRSSSPVQIEDDPLVVRFGDRAAGSQSVSVEDDPLIVRYGTD